MHISTHIPQINALFWVAAYRSLADPYVILSHHTALVTQKIRRIENHIANARIDPDSKQQDS